MSALSPAPSNARLLLPRAALAGCVRAYVVRNTVEVPLTDPAQRLNRFPATPLCSVSFYIEGEAELVEPPLGTVRPFVRALVMGPQTRPLVTYNPGPVLVFSVIFPPQSMQALAGCDMSAWVDQILDVRLVLPPEWSTMAEAVLAAPSDEARIAVVEDFLEPRWQAIRAADGALAQAGDWLQHLAMQAATAGIGRGVRNVERRIKAWAGLPMRRLRRMQRSEESFFRARDAVESGSVSWAELAARAGYADQAHFCRETREITGHTPAELARVSDDDESYWIYRLWN